MNYNTNVPLQRGYYILSSLYLLSVPFARVTYSTYVYSCPFNLEFADVNFNFQGCNAPTRNQPGHPCLAFDFFRQVCIRCANTHVLVNGTCLYSTDCPPRTYFHFGSCLPVSETCLDFDRFTGACLSCISFDMRLIDGNCTFIDVKCGARQWIQNNICFNVSELCG